MTSENKWYALWTRSHFEKLVFEQLRAKGFNVYLPQIPKPSMRAKKEHIIVCPMFPGYLFLKQNITKESYLQVVQTRGLVRILGDRWDALTQVPEWEIERVRKLTSSPEQVRPYPFLEAGHRVKIVQGSLRGLEGFLIRQNLDKNLLVISVELLQRSVAVEIDEASILPLPAKESPAENSGMPVPQRTMDPKSQIPNTRSSS